MVVTIVVLLILAGVTISLLLDENGIIKKSKDARREYGTSKTNEQEQMDNAADWIDEAVTGKVTLAKVPVGTKASKNGTINGEEGNSNNPNNPKNLNPNRYSYIYVGRWKYCTKSRFSKTRTCNKR